MPTSDPAQRPLPFVGPGLRPRPPAERASYLMDDHGCRDCRRLPCQCDALYEDGVERRRNRAEDGP